jgi:hypothetical protein
MAARAAESDHLFRFVPVSDAQSAGPYIRPDFQGVDANPTTIRPGPETIIGIDRHKGGIQASFGKNPSAKYWDSLESSYQCNCKIPVCVGSLARINCVGVSDEWHVDLAFCLNVGKLGSYPGYPS